MCVVVVLNVFIIFLCCAVCDLFCLCLLVCVVRCWFPVVRVVWVGVVVVVV